MSPPKPADPNRIRATHESTINNGNGSTLRKPLTRTPVSDADGTMNILGISCFYHDSAACLLADGRIVAAVQEERFSRRKHDQRFPVKAIAYCLSEGGLTVRDLDCVVFYDKPFLTFERLLMSYLTVAPRGLKSWLAAMPSWLGQKLHVPKIFKREIGYEGEVLYTEHHEAHAASAFYPSPFKEAAILTVDGVGQWATASCGIGRGKDLDILKELHFPDSVGLLYSAFTYFTGFRVNSGEYKLMGLAPYGKPVYRDLILEEVLAVKEDGSIRLNHSLFDFIGGLRMTHRRFDRLFGGPPRKPGAPITRREMDMAASIQHVVEEIILKMARHLYHETGMKQLCMAGGVALNCVVNGRVLREGPFSDIWIQPAAGDAGGALGAALSVWHRFLGNERIVSHAGDGQDGSYLGPAFSQASIQAYLEENDYPYHALDSADRAKRIAEEIDRGRIVGHFSGRMEFGPRALGARSILGDPRRKETPSVLNSRIKYRESFRPFAPSVLEEKAADYFDIDRPCPYMLLAVDVRKDRRLPMPNVDDMDMLKKLGIPRSDIPAVTHLDYSARIQSVSRKANPDYYAIIEAFEKRTGCGVVVNTSFNVRGEPIVCTPRDAYRCFMRTGMDVLVLENCILFQSEQPEWNDAPSCENESDPDKKEIRIFGLAAAIFFGCLGGLSIWRAHAVPAYFFGLLSLSGAGLLLAPVPLAPVHRGWLITARFLGCFFTRLMLTAAYCLVITPTAILKRIFGGRPLSLGPVADASTFWIARSEPLQQKERFYKRY
jgi:carbamoyltransferase